MTYIYVYIDTHIYIYCLLYTYIIYIYIIYIIYNIYICVMYDIFVCILFEPRFFPATKGCSQGGEPWILTAENIWVYPSESCWRSLSVPSSLGQHFWRGEWYPRVCKTWWLSFNPSFAGTPLNNGVNQSVRACLSIYLSPYLSLSLFLSLSLSVSLSVKTCWSLALGRKGH